MLDITTSPGTTTISVVGDLDLTVRDQFPEATARVSAGRQDLVVLDLCRMDFLDSTGAAFVAGVGEAIQRGGGVAVLRGADEHASFVLEVCGVLPLFRVDEEHTCTEESPRADLAR